MQHKMVSRHMKHKDTNIATKIRRLYTISQELEQEYPGRKFTPDGHLVGSIGEILVAEHYSLILLPNSAETHDAVAKDGRLVQIKATQTQRIAISSEPEHLIVIKISKNGDWEEVYNGPGTLAWNNAGKMQKNGQRPITLGRLKDLMKVVKKTEMVSRE